MTINTLIGLVKRAVRTPAQCRAVPELDGQDETLREFIQRVREHLSLPGGAKIESLPVEVAHPTWGHSGGIICSNGPVALLGDWDGNVCEEGFQTAWTNLRFSILA